jgi:F-type H+-transporting ATPase subunit delta
MDQSKIAVRYARALFMRGKETGETARLYEDIQKIDSFIHHSEEMKTIISNPVIRFSQKKIILQKVLQPHVGELTLRFIILVAENKREQHLPGICRNFTDMVRNELGIVPAVITTARPLTGEIPASIRKSLEKETGKTIELSEKINPSIIGGMILRIEDLQYDGSISGQLDKIKSAMLL